MANLTLGYLQPFLHHTDQFANSRDSENDPVLALHGGFAAHVREIPRLTVGIGLFTQGGLGTDFRNLTTAFGTRDDASSFLRHIKLAFAASYEIVDGFSIGVAPHISYSDLSFRLFPKTSAGLAFSGVDLGERCQRNQGLGEPGGDCPWDVAGGVKIGAAWKVTPMVTVGLAYTSPADFHYHSGEGKLNFSSLGLGRVSCDVDVLGVQWPVHRRARRRVRGHPECRHRARRLQLGEQPAARAHVRPRRAGAVRASHRRRRRREAVEALGDGRGLLLRAAEEGHVHEPRAAVRDEGDGQPAGLPARRHHGVSLLSTATPTTRGTSAARLRYYLVWTYVIGSAAAVAVTFFLIGLGLEFTLQQWIHFLIIATFVIPCYTLPDIYLISRHIRPISSVLAQVDRGERPSPYDVSRAIVRALNLPYFSFLRVTFFHGPSAALMAGGGMVVGNSVIDSGFAWWQIIGVTLNIFLFASPTRAIAEFFVTARKIVPEIQQLWAYTDEIDPKHQGQLIAVPLRSKLLYLSVFVNMLPLLFLAGSMVFKTDRVLVAAGISAQLETLMPVTLYAAGVALVCMVGTLVMSVLTASEVSRSAARLAEAMRGVEQGDLNHDLRLSSTDEYAALFRGFNLMVGSLREEVRILQLSHALAGELNLDKLLTRLVHATSELLGADRCTLFLYDRKTGELFSRIAEGLEIKEIRIPSDRGIAGAVFTTRKTESITDPYKDPRFNQDVDRSTGYRTESILAMPIINKAGDCIGVTEVLNKKAGRFTAKDETRLGAFTAQITIALENAKLFEDVLNEKNYNEGILRSTTDGIVTLDATDKILTANDAALKIMKRDRSELIGKALTDAFTGQNSWVPNTLERVKQSGKREIAVEMELHVGERDIASVNLAMNPLIDINEEQIGSMIVVEDITSEKRIRSTMARYMSPEIADQLLAEGEQVLGGKDQQASILFSDIRSFTTMSESLGARDPVAMLNEYFEQMVDVVLSHGGVLDKFIGDAVMALFGVPFKGEHDADDAVRVANTMWVVLRQLNRERRAQGKAPIAIGVGIASGIVVVGNIGSTKRMEYTAIGDTVNLASRLEGATKYYGVGVLLGESTKQELTAKTLVREMDLLRVKGKHEPVAIYEAMDHLTEEEFPNLTRGVELYSEGIRLYRDRAFKHAMDCFKETLSGWQTFGVFKNQGDCVSFVATGGKNKPAN
ncbi:MAG: GAF domain-containing protein [Candidatus Rokubacteria bacterium]|nr:GAF domain-containing protein [Candidatus Rokubacteria bacterium]